MTDRYQRLPWPCNLSATTLAEARLRGLPFVEVYTLYVHPAARWDATLLLHEFRGRSPNPFEPQINLIFDDSLSRWEWFIEAPGGHRVGSPGAG